MNDVDKFVSQFTDTKIGLIFKQGRQYFLVNEEQKLLSEKIGKTPFSAGIFLGEKKDKFFPTPALLDMISNISDKKIFLSKKAEWLFLCGRDVLKEGITGTLTKEKLVLVQNKKNENLGYGMFIKKGKDKIVKNLLDKGFYLRRER